MSLFAYANYQKLAIGFFDHGLSFRGTSRAIISYANGLRRLNPSISPIIFYLETSPFNNLSILNLTKQLGLQVVPISSRYNLNSYKLDALYHIFSGPENSVSWLDRVSPPKLMHQCGYNAPLSDFKSGVFAYVGHWQNLKFSRGMSNVLPHIIEPALATRLNQRKKLFARI